MLDPWRLLAMLAARTSRSGSVDDHAGAISRPWQLAKETVTLDRLSAGRLIFGVGLGSPARADFRIFHEPTDARVRAELLDEGLDVLAGLWAGRSSPTGAGTTDADRLSVAGTGASVPGPRSTTRS